MGSNDGTSPAVRAEALGALFRKLQAATQLQMKPAEIMVGAGDLLRRTRAAGLGESQVESLLGAVPRDQLEAWLARDPAIALEAALERALSEGAEAGLAEDGEEREVWASSAHEALMSRDRAESARVAISRWESLKGEELEGAEELRDRLEALDDRFRRRARSLVGLNRRRRVERDLLDETPRSTAWWFTFRSDCDDLLRLLAGTAPAGGEQHLAECSLCREDLKRSQMVERPPERHLTSAEAWQLDMDLLPAEERRALRRHAETCTACAQVLRAMDEGEKAIEDLEREERPSRGGAARGRGDSDRRSGQRARRQVALERREFRLVVVRDRGRVRLLVQPREARGFAAAKVTIPPQRKALSPKSTSDGLEFDLGPEEDLRGRTARVTLKITERGDPIQAEVSL